MADGTAMRVARASDDRPLGDTGPVRTLAAYATQAHESAGRVHAEPGCPMRTPYQRDRDRIVHATAFRRLTYKTQVFVFHEGDHYRTRLTHSLEVAQIARAIARMLALDEDLAEALALAHDLGHPPFGHAGERALAQAMAPYGGFDHNAQSFKVVTRLERKYAGFDGLNLTMETLEGLAKHNGPLTGEDQGGEAVLRGAIAQAGLAGRLHLERFAPAEAQAAAVADDIAYNSHDLDDGLRAGLIGLDDLADVPLAGPFVCAALSAGMDKQRVIYEVNRRIITAMIDDVVREFRGRLAVLPVQSLQGVREAGRPVVAASPAREREIERAAALSLCQRLPPPAGDERGGRRRDDRARSLRALHGANCRDAPVLAGRGGEKRERGGSGRGGRRFRRRHDRPLCRQGAPAPV